MSEHNVGSKLAGMGVAFALGAAIGGTLALLYAPKSGKDTRELVGKKMHELKDAAGHVIEDGKALIGDGKAKVHDAVEKGKAAVHEMTGSNRFA